MVQRNQHLFTLENNIVLEYSTQHSYIVKKQFWFLISINEPSS